MFDERRYDNARSTRGTPAPDGMRWFFIYSAWTDIKGFPTDTVYINQSCLARHATFHHARSEWIPAEQFVTLYDPSRTSQPGVGTLVRAHYNPANLAWEVFNAASDPFVLYALDKGVQGFSGGATPFLEVGATTGWVGSESYAGSESTVGWQYLDAEAAPGTNGNYKITKDGMYRLVIDGWITLVAGTTPATFGNSVGYTTGPATAGTAHTHQVTIPDFQTEIQRAGPNLTIELWNKKAAGGAIARHTDDLGEFYYWNQTFPRFTNTTRWAVNTEWDVNLTTNDRVAFKFLFTPLTYWKVTIVDSYRLRLRVTNMGAKKTWTAF